MIKQSVSEKREHFHDQVEVLSNRINNKITQIQEVITKRKEAVKIKRAFYKQQLRTLKKELRADWKQWALLTKQITALV